MTAFRKSNSSSTIAFGAVLGVFAGVLGPFGVCVRGFVACWVFLGVVVFLLLWVVLLLCVTAEIVCCVPKSMLDIISTSTCAADCCIAFFFFVLLKIRV